MSRQHMAIETTWPLQQADNALQNSNSDPLLNKASILIIAAQRNGHPGRSAGCTHA